MFLWAGIFNALVDLNGHDFFWGGMEGCSCLLPMHFKFRKKRIARV